MKSLYLLAGISKQGHSQAIKHFEEEKSKEPCYIGLIESIREMHPGMGLRKMYEQFQPEGIGRDAFIELGLREGFRLRSYESPHKTTLSNKRTKFVNLLDEICLTNVNQVWVSDIFYFPLDQRHYYVVLIMDVYSRRIIGYSVADNMRAENNIAALKMALELRGVDNYKNELIHHSDRGGQYTSNDYVETLEDFNIRISMCVDVLENAHCERVNGTIKNQYLRQWNITKVQELFFRLPMAVDNYNNRLHNSLDMTPIQYETYIKELKLEQRLKMKIFTMKNQQNVVIKNQLSLF